MQSRVRNLTDQARFLAQTVQLEVQRAGSAEALAEALERRQSSTETRYPFISIAVVPVVEPDLQGRAGAGRARPEGAAGRRCRSSAGAGQHLPAPTTLPKWIGCDGFAGLDRLRRAPATTAAARRGANATGDARGGAARSAESRRGRSILDMPLSTTIEQRIQQETGIRLGEVTALARAAASQPSSARPLEDRPVEPDDGPALSLRQARWVVFLDHVDWDTGEPESASVGILINTFEIYDRISVVSPVGLRPDELRPVAAARAGVRRRAVPDHSVRGAGDRLRAGAADHRRGARSVHRHPARARRQLRATRFPVRARDQLGELAESFNLMTGEVTTLLGEMAEKGRLEQEMFAAREIQQKLLPTGPAAGARPGRHRRSANRRARWPATTTTSCRSPTRSSAC